MNQNGRSVSPNATRPSQEQENLLLGIYPAHIDPSAVQYVEAHGTGTSLGDPTEAEALGKVIGKRRSSKVPVLKIGSVKGNIGHTESASGAAGLIKVLLMMHHGKFVPSLYFSESTSSINTKRLNLSVPTTVENWEESSEFGRVAGVNCFGFGGTNAHVVVRQLKQTQVSLPAQRPVELFVISAASGNSLKLTMADTAKCINNSDSVTLPNLAYTSRCRRSHRNYKYRKAFVASSIQHLEQQLISAAGTETAPPKKPPQLVFVFSGNILNFKGICKILLKYEPVFRDKCIEIKQLFQHLSPNGILELTESEHEDLSKPEVAQPLLFTLQVALATLLQYWGIKPIAAVGHSVGEVAAAHCAGVISLEDAVKVIYHRSRLQAKVTGGAMLVVSNIPVQEVRGALGTYSGKVCIAALNSPLSCTLSGDAESIHALQKDLVERFNQRNIYLHALNVPAAYHSHMMDPVLKEMVASLSGLEKGKPEIELISTATGRSISDGDFVTGNYWARQAREPVYFAQAIITSAKRKENIVYIEIGPHKTLQKYIIETLGEQTRVFPSLHTDREYVTLIHLVKDLFELGLNVDWQHFCQGYRGLPLAYPRYQFDRKKFMSHLNINQQAIHRPGSSHHPLICSANKNNTEFFCSISQTLTPYLFEQKNHGVISVPAAFFVELALAAVMAGSRPKVPLCLCQMSITFTAPCVLNENSHDMKIKVNSQKPTSEFRVLSGSGNTVYVSGEVTKNPEISVEEKSISFQDIFQRCRSVVSKDEVYETLLQSGFHYGPPLKQLNDVFCCEELKEAITTVKVARQIAEEMYEYCIHPVLLDCFLQMARILATVTFKSKLSLPSVIRSLAVARVLEEEMMIYLKISKFTDNYVEFCGCFTDKHGSVLVELKCVQLALVKNIPREESDVFFETKWKEITSCQTMQNLPKAPRLVVFADKSGIAEQLKHYLHSESKFIMYQDWDKMLVTKRAGLNAQAKMLMELQGYNDVLFMWGIQKLNDMSAEKVVKSSARCCEAFRQVVVGLREQQPRGSITTVTYRTSEGRVDHVNTGFGLYGMVRTCLIEVPEITFQIIDISSTSSMDISALADVLVKYKAQDYPEVWIDDGRIYTSEIRRTLIEATAFTMPSQSIQDSEMCALYTAHPYSVNELSAGVANPYTHLGNHNVEVQVERISIHSEDYFPISESSCKFGKKLYWNSHTTDKHKLLSLDFSGTITATGIEVKKLKAGDHITSCYPVSASSRVHIPAVVSFNTQKFPCFKNVPCMSFFWVAKEVLLHTLPKPKSGDKIGIVSLEPESVLSKVLTFSAQETGWKTTCTNQAIGLWQRVNQCNALVFLPPLNGIFKECLTCLFHLRDIVLVYGNEEPECLRHLIGSDQEHIHIHIVNLIHTFQRAALIQSQKEIYEWLKSMNMKQLKELPFSPFQQAVKSERSQRATSYFNCKSVPVAVLQGGEEDNETSDIPVVQTERRLFKQNAVYVITGALTGLGFETVKFVAQNGGGHLVMLSQKKPSAEIQKEINDLHHRCEWTRIVSLPCSVVSSSEVEKAIKSISKIFPGCLIKGVFHSAMAVHDGPLETLTMSHFTEVLNPKVAGAINLHHATLGHQLDHFVCYSSLSSFLGNATQSTSAAANSFLDLFCHYRRNSGLSGQSINWGALNLGVLSGQHGLENTFQTMGIEVLQVNELHEYLKRSLVLNKPQQVVAKLHFQTLANLVLPQKLFLKSRFHNLVAEEIGDNTELTNVFQTRTLDEPINYIMSLLNGFSDTNPVEDPSMHTTLSSLGIDSMLAFTLQNRIFVERGQQISLAKLLDSHSTVLTLILHLKENSSTVDFQMAEGSDIDTRL